MRLGHFVQLKTFARQFYDRAGTLAKQGHTVDKVEIIVLGGTWSHYPRDYQARPRKT